MTTLETVTSRALTEALRRERRETRLFVVAELATTRRRLARLEARLFLDPGEPDFIDSYAEKAALAFDAPALDSGELGGL
jgi:hypothetical protein